MLMTGFALKNCLSELQALRYGELVYNGSLYLYEYEISHPHPGEPKLFRGVLSIQQKLEGWLELKEVTERQSRLSSLNYMDRVALIDWLGEAKAF